MLYTISNGKIELTIESHGAEIKSLKKENKEYMWHGDPAFWGRTSPVLFPIVGSLKGKSFRKDGETYTMGQHGFARDTEFTLLKEEKDSITFRLQSDAGTISLYPYDFCLDISYILDGESVKVNWRVENPGEKVLDFQIGAHPAFLCGMDGYSFSVYTRKREEGFEPYDCWEDVKCLTIQKLCSDGSGTLNPVKNELPIQGVLSITPKLFAEDALICSGYEGEMMVAITNPEGDDEVSVIFDAPLFGLWSPAGKNAPFVCIEPWYGRCDAGDFVGEFAEREYMNHLLPGEIFERSYMIVV